MTEQEKVAEVPVEKTIYTFHEEALAIPYRVEFKVPYADLKTKFDEYWGEKSDILINHFKPQVKKSKGGNVNKDKARKMLESNVKPGKLYQEAIANFLIDNLKEQGKDILHLEALDLYDYEEGQEAQLIGVLYYYPELSVDHPEALVYQAKSPIDEDFDKAWRGKQVELKHKYKKVSEVELTEGLVQDNHELLLDVIASCDGQPYEAGTIRGKWLELRTLFASFRQSFEKRNIGDLFETDFDMNGIDPDTKGKPIHATVKIFKAKEIIYREVDDSVAIEEGKENLEALKNDFEKEYKNYVEGCRKGSAADAIINTILQNSVISPLPDRWTELSVGRLVNNHCLQFKGDKDKAMSVIGAKDEESMRRMFMGEVYRDIYRVIAMKWYKKFYNVPKGTDEELYKDMLSRVNWVEKEEPKTEEVANV
jgi:hypothetical protein